ncbi:phosphoenolpyruvate carboxykinase (ATP) [Halovenus halobia]|uniref:phosphoenolpyruvate carboxykinase (ATP) n=1 Tax=Halovenus halobia TaxID=3396622 RepID=UPI003F57BAA3
MSQRVERSRLQEEFPDPEVADNVVYNPTFEQLREYASHDERTTEYGSPRYVSEQKSRSADQTKNLIDDEFDDADWEAISDGLAGAAERELVCLDRQVGRHEETSYTCRLFVPKEYSRIALAWAKLLEPASGEPDFQTLQLPEWDEQVDNERRICVLPDEGLTFVLGSDYTGEAKKSFLRLFMRRVKEQGGLGIHAGSKRVTIESDGELKTVGQAFLGLSATGKSTLTGHGCWLDEPEGTEMLQDDVCALLPDGQVTGSEGNGLYIKTDGLDEDEQPALYEAATDEEAVFENVWVDEDGTVNFDNTELTANGRAVIRREDLSSASEDIDMAEGVDQIFFITRNPAMPPVARLDDRQAAVAFMLGESIQTSAGDPDAAGESIRVVGTNPFIVGPPGEEGDRFRELIADNNVECFIINTGHVGPGKADIGVRESVKILVGAARGDITWRTDDTFGFEVPDSVPGIDVEPFYPPTHYDDFEAELERLRTERREYLEQFENLPQEIVDAVY